MSAQLTKKQLVLLRFIALGGEREIDPVRLMKGLFVVAQESPSTWLKKSERYDFTPYNWGPCSFDIYNDLRRLQVSGLISARSEYGRTWDTYAITVAGNAQAEQAASHLGQELDGYIQIVRNWVSSMSFTDLLKEIYKRYPDSAVNSVFKY